MAASRGPGPGPGPGVSVRVRITATVALLLLGGLVMAGAAVWTIESQRVDRQVADQADREFAEFNHLVRDGRDPETNRPFADPESMVRLFLERNVPNDDEVLVGWWDGGVRAQSPPLDRVTESAWFSDAVRPLLATNGTTTLDSPAGRLRVAAQRVQQGDRTGALVVVTVLDGARAGLHDTMRTYAVVAGLALVVVTAMAAWVSGRLLSPLRALRETADEISGSDLSRRLPVSGHDDITALTRTFNGMLERLEGAFVGQRQFLDDAGHELRTPLTVLRGHLELLDSDDPAEVAETRLLLLDEVDRMSRLVGDLTLLAKSGRPDFLHADRVDVATLTTDLVAKARGLGDRDWRLDHAAEAKLTGDEQRLTQALLQMADNAVKHTRPGDTIAIGSSYADGVVRLWVRDTGPGVPERDRELVFERFGRSAVPEHDEGFGLGLSIVAAIAHAHGGSVRVEDPSPPDPPGALFVMMIPTRGGPSAEPPPHPEEDPWPGS